VVDTELVNHPFVLRPQGDVMEIFRPVDTNPNTSPPSAETMMLGGPGKRCVVLMNQSSQDHTLLDVRPSPGPGRGAVSRQSSRDKHRKHSLPGSTVRREVVPSAPTSPPTQPVVNGTGTAGSSTCTALPTADGLIELDPHVTGQCVLILDEKAATELFNTIGEWLG
jgi:hypothetical protein